MKNSYAQLCVLLAASGFREQDFTEFAQSIIRRGPRAFVDDVQGLRNRLSNFPQQLPDDVPSQATSRSSSEVEHKIERLLLQDARLSKSEAVELLTAELTKRLPTTAIPPESRKGFQTWIHKLKPVISEKELLHLATNIRNQFVHERPTDWRLK